MILFLSTLDSCMVTAYKLATTDCFSVRPLNLETQSEEREVRGTNRIYIERQSGASGGQIGIPQLPKLRREYFFMLNMISII